VALFNVNCRNETKAVGGATRPLWKNAMLYIFGISISSCVEWYVCQSQMKHVDPFDSQSKRCSPNVDKNEKCHESSVCWRGRTRWIDSHGHSLEERVDVAAQVARIDPVVQLVLVLDDDAHLVLRTFQLLAAGKMRKFQKLIFKFPAKFFKKFPAEANE